MIFHNIFSQIITLAYFYFTGKTTTTTTTTTTTATTTTTQRTCGADQFQCKSGNCIYIDNGNCDGPCIQSSWVNDGTPECSDGSDESEYHFQTYLGSFDLNWNEKWNWREYWEYVFLGFNSELTK